MAPQEQSCVVEDFDEDSMFENIKALVLDDNKEVTFTFVAREFGINTEQAQGVLQKFADNFKDKVSTKVVLSGYKDDKDSKALKVLRFMTVDGDEVDECKEKFYTKVVTSGLQSIRKANTEKAPQQAIPSETSIRDLTDVEREQKIGFIRNEQIKIREGNVYYPAPSANVVKAVGDGIKATHVPVKKMEMGKGDKPIKPSPARTMFAKSKLKVKEEKPAKKEEPIQEDEEMEEASQDSKKEVDEEVEDEESAAAKLFQSDEESEGEESDSEEESDDEDSAAEDSEPEVKKRISLRRNAPKREKASSEDEFASGPEDTPVKKEVKVKAAKSKPEPKEKKAPPQKGKKRPSNKIESEESEDEVAIEKAPKEKRTGRRIAKFADSDDSEEEEKPKKKARQPAKKKKKIQISDDDESEEEKKPGRVKVSGPIDPKELVDEDEVHTDSDGFKVTIKKKKCVPRKEVQSCWTKEEKVETKEKEKPKAAPKKETKKENLKNLSNDKNKKVQKSITSFFKPKPSVPT